MAVSLSESPPPQGPMCPVCFRDYDASTPSLIPRILQCGHSYCTECLDRLLNPGEGEDDYEQVILNVRYGGREWTTTRRYPRAPMLSPFHDNEIKCPTCNSINRLSNRDVTGLTKNFALLSYQSMEPGPKLAKHFCNEHEHEKRIYCNDCHDLICAYCQLYGDHKSHSCTIASEAVQPSLEALKTSAIGLAEDFEALSKGGAEVKLAIDKLQKQKKRSEAKVRRYFGGLLDKLVSQRDNLLALMARWSEDQNYVLQAQHDSLTAVIEDSEEILKKCRRLIEDDFLDILTQQEDMSANVKSIRSRISNLSLQPIIRPWIRTAISSRSNEDETLTSLIDNCRLMYSAESHDASGDDGSEGHVTSEDPSDDDDDDDMIAGQAMGGFVTRATLHDLSGEEEAEEERAARGPLQERLRALQMQSHEWLSLNPPSTDGDNGPSSTNPRMQAASVSNAPPPSSSQAQASDNSNTMFLTPNFSNMLNTSHMLNLNLSAPPDIDLADDEDSDSETDNNGLVPFTSDPLPHLMYLQSLRQAARFSTIDDSEEEEEEQEEARRSAGFANTGVSFLDSLEMQRRFQRYLHDQDEAVPSGQRFYSSPALRSAHSDPPSPRHGNSEQDDHDSSSQQDDEEGEIVYPNAPSFSWTVGQGGMAHGRLPRHGSTSGLPNRAVSQEEQEAGDDPSDQAANEGEAEGEEHFEETD